MTWDEFKKAVEAEGVQPDDEIDYIDIGSVLAGLNVEQRVLDGERRFSVTD